MRGLSISVIMASLVWVIIEILFSVAIIIGLIFGVVTVIRNINSPKAVNAEDLVTVHTFLDTVYEASLSDTDNNIMEYLYKDKNLYIRFVEEKDADSHSCYISFYDTELLGENYESSSVIKLCYKPDLVYSNMSVKYYSSWEAIFESGFFTRIYDGKNPFNAFWTDWYKLMDAIEYVSKA